MGIAVGAEPPTIKLAIRGGPDEFTVLMVALVLISISYSSCIDGATAPGLQADYAENQ